MALLLIVGNLFSLRRFQPCYASVEKSAVVGGIWGEGAGGVEECISAHHSLNTCSLVGIKSGLIRDEDQGRIICI